MQAASDAFLLQRANLQTENENALCTGAGKKALISTIPGHIIPVMKFKPNPPIPKAM